MNSIICQNILQQNLNDKISNLLDKDVSFKTFKKKLGQIFTEYCKTVKIQNSSVKLLNYLVHDILDYSQLKRGKFRINAKIFDLAGAVEDIRTIMNYKAE